MDNRMSLAITVHGLWMSGPDMWLLRRRLVEQGVSTKQFSYPSLARSVEENSAALAEVIEAMPNDAPGSLHLVGHSLGGVLILKCLDDNPNLRERVGRVVLMGSPVRGSSVARMMNTSRVGRLFLGQSSQSGLEDDISHGVDGVEIGTIAGCREVGIGRFFYRDLNTPNDGTVAVSETTLENVTDSVVLPVSHSGMLFSKVVVEQTVSFLNYGRFSYPD